MEKTNRGDADSYSHPDLPKKVRIALLLAEDHDHTKTARLIGCSESYVRKIAKEYVGKGLLIRTAINPAHYQKSRLLIPIRTQTSIGGDSHQDLPINTPHKFQASFAQLRRPVGPEIHYDTRGRATIEETDHTIRFGHYKTTIWIKHFVGISPDEIIANAEKFAIALGETYAQRYGIGLGYLGYFLDIEWVKRSREDSKAQAKREGIRKGERIVVVDAFHKYEGPQDSHPHHIEYDAIPGGDKEAPTNHARIDHFIYKGGLKDALEALGMRDAKIESLLERITESIVVVNQKAETLAQEIEKLRKAQP